MKKANLQMECWSSLKYCLFISLLTWTVNSQCYSCVKTPLGNVQGSLVYFDGRAVQQYLGIPYAKPPVGDLRFRKTQPLDPWYGTLQADHLPPACIQYSEYPFPWYDSMDGKSEDCLYVNIWVPQSLLDANDTKIPVMFWMFGGGFIFGSNRLPIYNGQAIAAYGEIIVVTINYRLGPFGFFTAGTESAPGNMAIWDTLEALKWVNKNIAAFGGDPNQVTIAGESVGSWSVGLLCVSPLSKGLFHRAIMESGSPAYLDAENTTANFMKSQQLAQALGCADDVNSVYENPENVVKCMKGLSADRIVRTLSSLNPTISLFAYPDYGDEILPVNARVQIAKGNFHNVDVLIGNTRDEGPHSVTTHHPSTFGFFGHKAPQINKTFGENFLRSSFRDFSDPDAVVQQYLGDVEQEDYAEVRLRISDALGDFHLLCPTVYFAERYSQAGNSVYFYYFVHRPSTTPWAEWTGVNHFEEVPFVFGVPLQRAESYDAREILLSERMVRIWSSWVKHGKLWNTRWPLYSRQNPVYVKLDTTSIPRWGKGPHKNNCDFFRSYFGFE